MIWLYQTVENFGLIFIYVYYKSWYLFPNVALDTFIAEHPMHDTFIAVVNPGGWKAG